MIKHHAKFLKEVHETVKLLNSMIDSGESHTEKSRDKVRDVLAEFDRLKKREYFVPSWEG